MFALNLIERRVVTCASLFAFVGAVALVPSQASRLSIAAVRAAAPPRALAVPTDVLAERDPFVPQVDDPDSVPRTAAFARIAPLPPNAGAGAFPFVMARSTPRLLAVVTGPEPRALVDERGARRLVRAGDRVAGGRIATLDAAGITLDNGQRIALGSEQRR